MKNKEETHYLDEMEKDSWFLGPIIVS